MRSPPKKDSGLRRVFFRGYFYGKSKQRYYVLKAAVWRYTSIQKTTWNPMKLDKLFTDLAFRILQQPGKINP